MYPGLDLSTMMSFIFARYSVHSPYCNNYTCDADGMVQFKSDHIDSLAHKLVELVKSNPTEEKFRAFLTYVAW